MYYQYYGFKEPPFNLTPNSRFFYSSGKHMEALSTLLYGANTVNTSRLSLVKKTKNIGTVWITAAIRLRPSRPTIVRVRNVCMLNCERVGDSIGPIDSMWEATGKSARRLVRSRLASRLTLAVCCTVRYLRQRTRSSGR